MVWDVQNFWGFRLLVTQQSVWHSMFSSQVSPIPCGAQGIADPKKAPLLSTSLGPAWVPPGSHRPSDLPNLAGFLEHSQSREGGWPGAVDMGRRGQPLSVSILSPVDRG